MEPRGGLAAPAAPPAQGVTPEAFCDTLSRVPSGVTVVTVMNGDGRPHGTSVSAFCSLSLDPPLVVVALAHSSELLRHVRGNRRFGVNLLAEGQEHVGLVCGRKGPDKLAGIAWYEDEGLPRIEGSAAWIACELRDLLPGGDHQIVVGRVTRCETGESDALVFHRRSFQRLAR